MKRTLAICMIVYNEEDLLQFTLPQIKYHADEIIIVNGSPFGPSTDRTKQVIEYVIGLDGCTYCQGTYGEPFVYTNSFNSVMRNEYLKHVTSDFILQLDADEFWSFEDLERIKEIINDPKNSDITGINTGNYHFYLDVFHHIPGLGENQHHRIVKNVPTAHYSHDKPNSILYFNNRKPVATSRTFYQAKSLKCFHVGHALPWESYKKKQLKFYYKGYPKNCWNVQSIEELDALTEQRDPNHPKLRQFKGTYPEYMEEAIKIEHNFFTSRV